MTEQQAYGIVHNLSPSHSQSNESWWSKTWTRAMTFVQTPKGKSFGKRHAFRRRILLPGLPSAKKERSSDSHHEVDQKGKKALMIIQFGESICIVVTRWDNQNVGTCNPVWPNHCWETLSANYGWQKRQESGFRKCQIQSFNWSYWDIITACCDAEDFCFVASEYICVSELLLFVLQDIPVGGLGVRYTLAWVDSG